MFELDRDACFRALQTRDPRFDGRFFVAVRTTGIYCRPICSARTPKPTNCSFYPSALAAQGAGFRPCLLCRPEISPDLASSRGTSNTVLRALDLLAEGALDGDENRLEAFAGRLGVGERQLRRLFVQHLGASPIAVAQTRRFLFAKQLIHDTRLPMTEVAMAAGYGSIRRFNSTFQMLYGRPPRELRRSHKEDLPAASHEGVTLRIGYSPPYHWDAILNFLAARAIPGIEVAEHASYRRTIQHEGVHGWLEVTHNPVPRQLIVHVRFPCVRALSDIVCRVRRVFDTGADMETIERHLAADPIFARLVAFRPGLRTPGGWDGFELGIRAILGQQVTLKAARLLAGKLSEKFGEPVNTGDPRLSRAFPTAERLAEADLASIGIPRSRAAALNSLASAAAADPRFFARAGSLEEAVTRFRALRGVGEWTAQYIALRALREPDAFPASDLVLLHSASREFGRPLGPKELLDLAEPWRPWRAYAAQHLWANYASFPN